MPNEIGLHQAPLAKALINDGYIGQQIALLLNVDSRAVSEIEEEYPTVKASPKHNIPDAIFHLSKLDLLKIIDPAKLQKVYQEKVGIYGLRKPTKKEGMGSQSQIRNPNDRVFEAAYGMVDALNDTSFDNDGGDALDPVFLKHKTIIEKHRANIYSPLH